MERTRRDQQGLSGLVELSVSLSAEEAPELSASLAALYAYMQKRLLDANLKQQDEPLAEVLGLLMTLAEAWEGIPDAESEPETEKPLGQPNARGRTGRAIVPDSRVSLKYPPAVRRYYLPFPWAKIARSIESAIA